MAEVVFGSDAEELHGLDVNAVLEAHRNWVSKLKALRAEALAELDIEVISCDHACAMGKWLYGDGKAFESKSQYNDLLVTHAQFHACVGEVVSNQKKGLFLDAVSLMKKELPTLSADVEARLEALKKGI
ncbi:CZB domain-containing protein [Stenoxybacter acetivorans]|uniref:CZB domain-containing protein n=1 Tax=Stenoxybacter acetivorans TaxID=422441 RepID=UPI0014705834|nr:CZB domain-containing protein [Stenoxybacter acetivorans]